MRIRVSIRDRKARYRWVRSLPAFLRSESTCQKFPLFRTVHALLHVRSLEMCDKRVTSTRWRETYKLLMCNVLER